MRPLTARDLLAVWDAGGRADGVERALVVLAACLPERSREELDGLSVGERDALLLAAHTATFGPRLQGLATCPGCGERLEFSLDTGELPQLPPAGPQLADPQRMEAGGFLLEFRLPDSRDLVMVGATRDAAAARSLLAARCVLSVEGNGRDVPAPLPDAVVDALAAEMARRQPWSDVEVALECPVCAYAWQPPLEVGAFVWAEIAGEAQRLLHDVDALARTYHWREADILAMTTARRQAYLLMVQ